MTKDTKKQIIILIVILLVAMAIGVGLFAFLRYARDINKKYNLEDRTITINYDLNKIEKEYTKFKDCKLDLSKVDVTKAGKYEYNIKCKKNSSSAYIYVK